MERYTVYFIWKLLYMVRVVEQFPDKINCVTLHLVGYMLEKCKFILHYLLMYGLMKRLCKLPEGENVETCRS